MHSRKKLTFETLWKEIACVSHFLARTSRMALGHICGTWITWELCNKCRSPPTVTVVHFVWRF